MAAGRSRKEPSLLTFVKATIIGGLLFLLPVVIASILLGHAMQIAVRIVRPIAQTIPDEFRLGYGLLPTLAVMFLLLVCLLAGFAARTAAGRRVRYWMEDSFLGNLPQYRLMKTMGEGLAEIESVEGLKPALASVEGGWQLGYIVEPLPDGWLAVFLPQSPTPMSGNVLYLPGDKVRPLELTMLQAISLVKRAGAGSAELLRGVELRLPGEG